VVFSTTNGLETDSANLTFSGTILTSTGFAGPLNGTVGATTPAAGSFTSLTDSGNLTFTGTGNRITGDFSNATIASRVAFQSSTVNGNTIVPFIPNGTSTNAQVVMYNDSGATNASTGQFAISSSELRIASGLTGTGTYLPMTFYTAGSERMRLDTSGNVGIGTSSPSSRLAVNGGTSTSQIRWEVNNAAYVQEVSTNAAVNAYVYKSNDASYHVWKLSSTEAMRLDSSGNVGIGTSSPSEKLRVTSTGTNEIRSHSSSSGDARVGFWAEGAAYNYIQTVRSSGALSYFADLQTFNNGSGTERARIDSSGNVGIGTNAPSTALTIARTGANAQILVSTTTSGNPSIYLDASGVNNGQLFVDRTDAGITKLQAGGVLVFQTNGATERARIDTSGNVLVTNPAGLGYGTGSGGTVTQATSKSTAVTLNKPTGQITMDNALLLANTNVSFTLNNSLLSATDTLLVHRGSAGSAGVYFCTADGVGAGSCSITVRNTSASSLSEAIVLNFTIIKGATS
jgi:hypothetical protein